MLDTILSSILDRKSRDVGFTVGGMAMLTLGRKATALGLIGRGLYGLEKAWRERNPDVKGWGDRWRKAVENYEASHQHPTNRTLHRVGIPMIVGGALGLLAFPAYRPLWLASAASFGVGWALNIAGHVLFEKNAPALADDPLSFVVGPVWDFRQRRAPQEEAPVAPRRQNGAVAQA